MKNYPNQAATFSRIRRTLQTVAELNSTGAAVGDDGVLGYELAARGVYTFRYLDPATATQAQIAARIALERAKPPGDQGARTNARELRRTMRDMGWLTDNWSVTAKGEELLDSVPDSVAEQSLLVEGLLSLTASDSDGNIHHPVPVMLKLLGKSESHNRAGLELALEPRDDSASEFERVAELYELSAAERAAALGITDAQRANAVKVFPSLAIQAGLVVEEGGYYSLSQDGLAVIGRNPAQAAVRISSRRGRRTTVGRRVTADTVASRRPGVMPRALTPEEQAQASARLAERTGAHQEIVKRIDALIGDVLGNKFEDPYSYDLMWVPDSETEDAILFEMKTITDAADAYARVKDAVGQLSYYSFFNTQPTVGTRAVARVMVVNGELSKDLIEYLTHESVGALLSTGSGTLKALNALGQVQLDRLQTT